MKHLRYFEALARHRHFGHAADACAISQPALSVQIRELEDLIGAPLVERRPREIRLTGLGEEFATRIAAILRSVDELNDLARASQVPLGGRLRLGVIPTIAPYLLPGLIKALGTKYPGLELRPREAVTPKLIEDLRDARLDAALVALPISEANLHEEELFEEEFVLLRPASEAEAPVPRAHDLPAMRLLLLEEGHCFRDQAISFCSLPFSGTRSFMDASSLTTLVQMVGAGIGVTLLPEMAIAIETRSAPVSVARLGEPFGTRRIGLVWRGSSPLGAELTALAHFLRAGWQTGLLTVSGT